MLRALGVCILVGSFASFSVFASPVQASDLKTQQVHRKVGENLDWVDAKIRDQDHAVRLNPEDTISLRIESPHDENESRFDRAVNRLKDAWVKLDINLNANIGGFDPVDGVTFGFGIGYGLAARPGNQFYRMDKMSFNFAIEPGDYLSELPLPLYIGLGTEKEIVYVRKFTSHWESKTASPLQLKILPTTAERALQLKSGEFFALPTHANFEVSGNLMHKLGFVTAQVGAKYVMSGDFVFHIFRLEDGQVRVKIFSNKSRDAFLQAKLYVPFELFEIDIVNSVAESIADRYINFNLIELGIHQGEADSLIVDYVFDLNDSCARQAYDDLMGNANMLNVRKVVSAHLKKKKVMPIANLDYVDALSQAEDVQPPVVRRIFKGSVHSQIFDLDFGISLLFGSSGVSRGAAKHNLVFVDHWNRESRYNLQVFQMDSGRQLAFDLFHNRTSQKNFLLLNAGSNNKPRGLHSYGVTFQRDLKNVHGFQLRRLFQHLQDNLPLHLFARIPWSQIDYSPDEEDDESFEHMATRAFESATEELEDFYTFFDNRKEGNEEQKRKEKLLVDRVKEKGEELLETLKPRHRKLETTFQVIFRKEALQDLSHLTYGDLRAKYDEYTELHPQDRLRDKFYFYLAYPLYLHNLNTMLTTMEHIFDTAASDRAMTGELSDDFMDLRFNPVFSRFGLGFLFHLLQGQDLEKVAYFSLVMSASDRNPISFEIGSIRDKNLYHQLQYTDFNLHEFGFDVSKLEQDQVYYKRIADDLTAADAPAMAGTF